MEAVRYIEFLNFKFFDARGITGPDFVKIGQTIAEISIFCDFQDGGNCHFGFSNIRNFNGHSSDKFHPYRSNGCRDMAI